MPEELPCIPFVRTRQVAFHDTDASGVAHFTRLLCLVEEVDYASSAGLGDWLSIELSLGAVGTSSLEWKFAVFHSEHPVMSGRYVVVRVGKGGGPQAISESEKECLISGFSKGGDACK